MWIPCRMKAGQEMRWELWVKLKRADVDGTLYLRLFSDMRTPCYPGQCLTEGRNEVKYQLS